MSMFSTPYVICTSLKSRGSYLVFDFTLDAFMLLDMIINFFTAYEDEGKL